MFKGLVLCLLVACVVAEVADLSGAGDARVSGDTADATNAELKVSKMKTEDVRVYLKKQAMASSICHVAWQHLRANPKCAVKPAEEDLGEGMEVETQETTFAYVTAMQEEIQNAVARVEPAKKADLKKADAKKKAAAAKKKAEAPPKAAKSTHANAQDEGQSKIDGMKREDLMRIVKVTETAIAICKRSYMLAKAHCK